MGYNRCLQTQAQRFEFISIAGVATDLFGRVLVAEAGIFQLVVVDRDGRVERCFGKRGRAEGEFRDIQGIAGADWVGLEWDWI
jgi:hypothetical protein